MSPNPPDRDEFRFELAAESITVRIRWVGVCVGYVLVNVMTPQQDRAVLNGILTLGVLYAIVDTLWSLRGKVFLSRWPLVISMMEAVFIGLLCYFDNGHDSPFRYYYFLSLLVCAIRYSPWITYSTFALHAMSFSALAFTPKYQQQDNFVTLIVTLVLLIWVTWASTALANLMRSVSQRLEQLNDQLHLDQSLLEDRIQSRTQELQESQALLVQQEKQAAFGLLAAGIAHEVGNPLAAISSLVQMLNRRHADDYTRQRLQLVDDQLVRIQRILRELVDFSRPATSEETRCSIHNVLDAALSIAKYYKRKKGKKISTHYSKGLPPLRIVRDQMVQVFLNLILNAMDATDEGGLIEITTTYEDGYIRVDLRDDGHGITEDNQAKIFQPYFTTKATGTGLGLFVCKKLVQQSAQGRISMCSSTGVGTTFTVCLKPDEVSAPASPNDPLSSVKISTS